MSYRMSCYGFPAHTPPGNGRRVLPSSQRAGPLGAARALPSGHYQGALGQWGPGLSTGVPSGPAGLSGLAAASRQWGLMTGPWQPASHLRTERGLSGVGLAGAGLSGPTQEDGLAIAQQILSGDVEAVCGQARDEDQRVACRMAINIGSTAFGAFRDWRERNCFYAIDRRREECKAKRRIAEALEEGVHPCTKLGSTGLDKCNRVYADRGGANFCADICYGVADGRYTKDDCDLLYKGTNRKMCRMLADACNRDPSCGQTGGGGGGGMMFAPPATTTMATGERQAQLIQQMRRKQKTTKVVAAGGGAALGIGLIFLLL